MEQLKQVGLARGEVSSRLCEFLRRSREWPVRIRHGALAAIITDTGLINGTPSAVPLRTARALPFCEVFDIWARACCSSSVSAASTTPNCPQ
jgi:hypothetical protein